MQCWRRAKKSPAPKFDQVNYRELISIFKGDAGSGQPLRNPVIPCSYSLSLIF